MRIHLEQIRDWRLYDAPFLFQQTYATPLKSLTQFVKSLLSPFVVEEAVIRIETIVFTPNEFISYLRSRSIETNEADLNHASIFAESPAEVHTLLEEVLGQWIDFAFLPEPRKFAIYADHDEFTTIFTETEEAMTCLREEMNKQSFKAIDNWQWTGPHSLPKIEEGTNV